jgi:cytochrome c peroxidase
MKLLPKALLTTLFSLAAIGCGDATPDEQPVAVVDDGAGDAQRQLTVQEQRGKDLFKNGTFGGNGRTCTTCHSMTTGTFSPADAQARFNANPNDPLFLPIDSNGGNSNNYSELLTQATVTVDIPLHANVQLASNPTARTITLRRGVPTTIDAPFFDTMLMFDGRASSLQDQARGAIMGHAQAPAPAQADLDAIAAFEKTIFSSAAMEKYAKNQGPAPGLPAGTTAAEKRGAAWFAPTGLCGSCHGGVLLNRMTAGNPMGLPEGAQFGTALVADLNLYGKPQLDFIFTKADGTVEHVLSADPGLALITGDPGMKNLYKMTSLRNLKNTAPYFSDNSAKTIPDIMVQYNALMNALGIPHTQQDLDDITAYMYLL